MRLPSTPREVLHAIRSSTEEPFTALRHASESARALHPPDNALPTTLPAFVLPSSTLMPGERGEFIFFEPRYRALAKQVLGLSGAPSREPPDGRYAHLAESDGIGTLASILDHTQLPDGRVAARMLAGPRCRVTKAARIEVVEEGAAPLLHVTYGLVNDDPSEHPAADAELARECIEELSALVPISKLSAINTNAPPLFSPERLSFWLCGVMIRPDDASSRMAWLKEQNTLKRLAFVRRALQKARDHRDANETDNRKR